MVQKQSDQALKKGMHVAGRHRVVDKTGLKVGQQTTTKGEEYETLSAARKAAKHGNAIVRESDGIVVSIK